MTNAKVQKQIKKVHEEKIEIDNGTKALIQKEASDFITAIEKSVEEKKLVSSLCITFKCDCSTPCLQVRICKPLTTLDFHVSLDACFVISTCFTGADMEPARQFNEKLNSVDSEFRNGLIELIVKNAATENLKALANDAFIDNQRLLMHRSNCSHFARVDDFGRKVHFHVDTTYSVTDVVIDEHEMCSVSQVRGDKVVYKAQFHLSKAATKLLFAPYKQQTERLVAEKKNEINRIEHALTQLKEQQKCVELFFTEK